MAEGGLRKLLENDGCSTIAVFSSGTAAASDFPATAYAIEAVRLWDADINEHFSQPLTPKLIEQADLILCMSTSHCRDVKRIVPSAREKTFLLKNYPEAGCEGEEIEDPIGGSLDMYNQTFLEIGEELGRILPLIKEAAASEKNRG
jgi:protein-tyrosine phosphatase